MVNNGMNQEYKMHLLMCEEQANRYQKTRSLVTGMLAYINELISIRQKF